MQRPGERSVVLLTPFNLFMYLNSESPLGEIIHEVPQLAGHKARKQVVLDGPVSSGKSIALAMLVHWARDEGWLVLYVPKGREWTHGGFFYKNPKTGLWDTPVQAANILQARILYFF